MFRTDARPRPLRARAIAVPPEREDVTLDLLRFGASLLTLAMACVLVLAG